MRPGEVELAHNVANDRGFEVIRDVRSERVLLVDDTFTTGVGMQSAASALQLAGAHVVVGVVVGRVIRPDFSEETRQLWDAARTQTFRFDRCCLER